MSYDLNFRKKKGEEFPLKDFEDYFASRPHYTVANGQAIYGNEATGVYFIMDHNADTYTDEDEGVSQSSFNLNYFRPHIFALEAEPEVRAFVEHFDFRVKDDQIGGHHSDIYDREAFIRGWNAGNKFSFQTITDSHEEILKNTLPFHDIERYWRWNYQRDELQKQLGDDIFVARVSFQRLNDKATSCAIWSEAIPTALPEVDTVIMYRESLAPSTFFGGRKTDFTIVDYSEILPFLSEVTEKDGQTYKVTTADEKTLSWIKSFPASTTKPEMIAVDQVLDREVVLP